VLSQAVAGIEHSRSDFNMEVMATRERLAADFSDIQERIAALAARRAGWAASASGGV